MRCQIVAFSLCVFRGSALSSQGHRTAVAHFQFCEINTFPAWCLFASWQLTVVLHFEVTSDGVSYDACHKDAQVDSCIIVYAGHPKCPQSLLCPWKLSVSGPVMSQSRSAGVRPLPLMSWMKRRTSACRLLTACWLFLHEYMFSRAVRLRSHFEVWCTSAHIKMLKTAPVSEWNF